ncbi:uncharacterized protein LY89DRAFT_728760 [Mollisia scopiformis]|uniref:Uncharacterized protein n=1 Tax=Mollisia scopiformis TaxID=149040 RepID=A0A194XQT5_MOLSC|nr:uncharacterized protein LY89DRAFT_728760 [Mollisia scopiformis]KUJ22640.1 hypothetical protein LY89DRAFT_728760 [Mollisia scopiformis]
MQFHLFPLLLLAASPLAASFRCSGALAGKCCNPSSLFSSGTISFGIYSACSPAKVQANTNPALKQYTCKLNTPGHTQGNCCYSLGSTAVICGEA